ncbi:MAG: undecaprenyldiphospho-muramoylpentapeptide beta-N-acetylglucosaminyltransferase [Anaerolineae bacterium]|nr:undecaprenyldiphospho-muramoylpentapeptide beta-N-acetylglucosaminyltransferase [Anaerolineae bacterium]
MESGQGSGQGKEAASVRIWIAGGGTGGHVYPSLAVVQALVAEGETRFFPKNLVSDTPHILYVGGEESVEERLVAQAGLRFVGVPAGGMHGLAPWRAARNLIKLLQGWWAAYRLGRGERPAALLATGGYASVPVSLAAWALRVPIMVYLPDIEPGLAVRVIARLAARVAVTVEDSRSYFPAHKVVVTGYPVRAEFHNLDRAEARASLGLASGDPVLLVMGGSRGARSINRALSGVLEQMLKLAQVVHVSGELDWPWVSERRELLPATLKARYHAFPYLHEKMGSVLAAADLAVCRAGASTLGELPFFGLPAVLVPYPHAWRYQRVNAEWLAERGAAVYLDDGRLPDELLPTVSRLLSDRAALEEMADRMQALSCSDAAARLASELWALARQGLEGGL